MDTTKTLSPWFFADELFCKTIDLDLPKAICRVNGDMLETLRPTEGSAITCSYGCYRLDPETLTVVEGPLTEFDKQPTVPSCEEFTLIPQVLFDHLGCPPGTIAMPSEQ